MRLRTLLLGLSLVLLPAIGTHAQTEASSYEAEIERWSQKRLARLTSPDGYLSLTGLHWLDDSPRRIPGVGTAHLDGKVVVLALEEGTSVDGQPVKEYRVGPDLPRGTPDFRHGTSHFFVIRHGSKVGLRVKNPTSETLRSFSGIERFPVDPAWRIVARFEADPATIPVPSVVDEDTSELSPGYAVFDRAGKTHKLRLMGEESDASYFLVFSDETAGKTTYSGMRFLEVEKAPDRSLILDFNKAENPPCSMTPFATCPLPPAGNILPFAVGAGEMTYKGKTH